MFSFFLAVVSSHAYILVAGKLCLHVLKLIEKAFLCTEYFETVKAYKFREIGTTLLPTVSAIRVAIVLHTNIVSGENKLVSRSKRNGKQRK